jgi:hypothetical protein
LMCTMLFLSNWVEYEYESNLFTICSRRVTIEADITVEVFVFLGFVFCKRTITMAASSRADLTSAIQYSFSTEVPAARSVKFSAVRRCR